MNRWRVKESCIFSLHLNAVRSTASHWLSKHKGRLDIIFRFHHLRMTGLTERQLWSKILKGKSISVRMALFGAVQKKSRGHQREKNYFWLALTQRVLVPSTAALSPWWTDKKENKKVISIHDESPKYYVNGKISSFLNQCGNWSCQWAMRWEFQIGLRGLTGN